MEKAGDNMLKKVQSCAKEASMDYDTLSTCYNGDESKKLQDYFYDLTPADHKYMPWVVVDGKLFNGNNFLKFICGKYKGTKPAGCSAVEEAPLRRCYA